MVCVFPLFLRPAISLPPCFCYREKVKQYDNRCHLTNDLLAFRVDLGMMNEYLSYMAPCPSLKGQVLPLPTEEDSRLPPFP